MCTGLGLLAMALYRMGAIKIDRKFMVDLLPLIIVTGVLAGCAFRIGGSKLANDGAILSAKMIAAYAPLLTVMFLAMGEATAIINLYRPALLAYLAGKQGVFGALAAAHLIPGSLTSMPIVRELWDAGANPVPLLTFVTTSTLVGWQIAMVRQPILGWRLTFITYCLGELAALSITGVGWVLMTVRA